MDWQAATNWDEFLDEFYSRGFGFTLPGIEELVFGVSTSTQSIGAEEEILYYFEVTEECVYEIIAEVNSGDADIYLISVEDSLTLIAYSLLYNPSDGHIDKIRLDLEPGLYIVDVYGIYSSSYELTVNKNYPTPLSIGSSVKGSGGTQEGDYYGHYRQIYNHYYQVSITEIGSYRFELTYDSDEVDFDLYLMSSSYSIQFTSENTGDVDALNVNFNSPTTVILCIYGYSGYGSFTIKVTSNNTATNITTHDVGITIPFILIALIGLCSSMYFIRKRRFHI